MQLPRVLTIAGSAAQGSGGLQADLRTFQEYDVYGMAAVTAIVAKNTVTEKTIFPCSPDAVEAQFYAALEGAGLDAVKTGMLFSEEIIHKTANLLEKRGGKHIVIDPVMIGKMGSQLLKDEAIEVMKALLFPMAVIITPNIHEAEKLLEWNSPIRNVDDMKKAAAALYQYGSTYVLVKGGALEGPAIDILYDGKEFTTLEEQRIQTNNTSGAGDTYAAAITAGLAKGITVKDAVKDAKLFVTESIRHGLSFDQGTGAVYQAAFRKFHLNEKQGE